MMTNTQTLPRHPYNIQHIHTLAYLLASRASSIVPLEAEATTDEQCHTVSWPRHKYPT